MGEFLCKAKKEGEPSSGGRLNLVLMDFSNIIINIYFTSLFRPYLHHFDGIIAIV